MRSAGASDVGRAMGTDEGARRSAPPVRYEAVHPQPRGAAFEAVTARRCQGQRPEPYQRLDRDRGRIALTRITLGDTGLVALGEVAEAGRRRRSAQPLQRSEAR